MNTWKEFIIYKVLHVQSFSMLSQQFFKEDMMLVSHCYFSGSKAPFRGEVTILPEWGASQC
jgi:hypothetical protein